MCLVPFPTQKIRAGCAIAFMGWNIIYSSTCSTQTEKKKEDLLSETTLQNPWRWDAHMVARLPSTVIADRGNEEIFAAPPVLLGKNKAPLCPDTCQQHPPCAGEVAVGDSCPKPRQCSSVRAHVLLSPGYPVLVWQAFGLTSVAPHFKLARHLWMSEEIPS